MEPRTWRTRLGVVSGVVIEWLDDTKERAKGETDMELQVRGNLEPDEWHAFFLNAEPAAARKYGYPSLLDGRRARAGPRVPGLDVRKVDVDLGRDP